MVNKMADDKEMKITKADGNQKTEEKKSEAPKPVKLDVDSFGKDGQYTFDIQVISDKGSGIQADIRIIEGDQSRATKSTDDNGFLEYTATAFSEEEREFLFRVVGYDLEYERTLSGPEKPRVPKNKIEKVSGGFMANFLNVIFENKRRKESKNE